MPDLGEKLQALRTLDLIQVAGLTFLEHDEIRRLTRDLGNTLEVGPAHPAQVSPAEGCLGQLVNLSAQGVPPRLRILLNIPARDQGSQKPVHGTHVKLDPPAEVDDPHFSALLSQNI
jgi:hypothetical protein